MRVNRALRLSLSPLGFCRSLRPLLSADRREGAERQTERYETAGTRPGTTESESYP